MACNSLNIFIEREVMENSKLPTPTIWANRSDTLVLAFRVKVLESYQQVIHIYGESLGAPEPTCEIFCFRKTHGRLFQQIVRRYSYIRPSNTWIDVVVLRQTCVVCVNTKGSCCRPLAIRKMRDGLRCNLSHLTPKSSRFGRSFRLNLRQTCAIKFDQ